MKNFATSYQTMSGKKVYARRRPDGTAEPVVDYVDHAPVPTCLVYADGLFKPLQRGQRKPLNAEFVRAYGTQRGTTLRRTHTFTGNEELDVSDQQLLFCLLRCCAMGASADFKAGQVERGDADFSHVCGWLKLEQTAQIKHLDWVRVGLPRLSALMGLSSTGTNTRAVRASLLRLSRVTVRWLQKEEPAGYLLDQTAKLLEFREGEDGAFIVLNPNVSSALYEGVPTVWVNLRERAQLKSAAARQLHTWLSAWATSRSVRTVGLDTLLPHVWGHQCKSASQRRDRRHKLLLALNSIAALPGWRCEVGADGVVSVRKPLFVGSQPASSPMRGTAGSAAVPAATPAHSAATTTVSELTTTAEQAESVA